MITEIIFSSFSHDRLPSCTGAISVIRRCGLGTGAGHTSFPRAGTSGKVNTISYRCCVFRKPTYIKGRIFRALKGKGSGKDLTITCYNGYLSIFHKLWTNPTGTRGERGGGEENNGEIYTEGNKAMAWLHTA